MLHSLHPSAGMASLPHACHLFLGETGGKKINNFDKAIEFVLKWEGGYVNHPDDPGGETKYGISKRAYPDLDVANLTLDDAKVIYKRDYWDKAECDGLETHLAMIVFDTAVNCGVNKAKEFFKKAKEDGQAYLLFRIEFYNKLNKPQFLKGWLSRVIDLWKEADKCF